MGIFYICSKCNRGTDNTCNAMLCKECEFNECHKTKRQKWQAWELAWIDKAIQNMYEGCSIYPYIEFLKSEVLQHRTWNSIRNKIGKKLKANKDLLLKCKLSKCKEKK